MNAEDLLKFIETVEVGALTPDQKTELYAALRKRFLGVEIPETLSPSLSLGGVQVVGKEVSFNIFDSKILLDLIERMADKDPEVLYKLAEIIAKRL
ncbi:MAG: hypothetical protein F6K14_11685 [Symploca sp. SIO2C1]|nr:hypothetical protein [Symploca sp. SIO2C1]